MIFFCFHTNCKDFVLMVTVLFLSNMHACVHVHAQLCPIWIPFICSSLISMSETSKTMLSKSGESGCIFLVHRWNNFRFSSLRMMLLLGLSYMTFIMLSWYFYAQFLEFSFFFFFLITNECCTLSKVFASI